MGLAFMWLRGVEGKQDQSRAIELLSQIADHAGDSLSSAAEYHLGRILYNPHDKMALAPGEVPLPKSPSRNTTRIL